LGLVATKVVTRAFDDRQVDERIDERDPLQHRERSELVTLALHDERRAAHALERLLIRGSRTIRWRDRMAEDRERIGRLDRREEGAHASAKAATDERDLVVVGAQRFARGAQVLELRHVAATRTLAARAEGDGAARDIESRKRAHERAQDALLGGASVPRSEDRRASQRAFARVFGSFCARSCAGASRSPTAARRADMFAIVKASGRPSAPISSQRSGADTGARRIGRTLYGPAVVLPPTFWRKSM